MSGRFSHTPEHRGCCSSRQNGIYTEYPASIHHSLCVYLLPKKSQLFPFPSQKRQTQPGCRKSAKHVFLSSSECGHHSLFVQMATKKLLLFPCPSQKRQTQLECRKSAKHVFLSMSECSQWQIKVFALQASLARPVQSCSENIQLKYAEIRTKFNLGFNG